MEKIKKLPKLLLNLITFIRNHVHGETDVGKAIVILAIILVTIRIIFPVRHLPDGYVIYVYPWGGVTECDSSIDCNIDRSRTAIESGSVLLLATSLLYTRHRRRRGKLQK